MAHSGGVSFTSLKNKVKQTAIGQSVSGKIHSLIGHDHDAETLGNPESTPSTPTHKRSESKDSIKSNKSDKQPSHAGSERRDSFELVETTENQTSIFEQQLSSLQEQLIGSMIENQNLATELAALKEKSSAEELRKELEMEKKRNAELQQKISAVRSSSPAESAQQKLANASEFSPSPTEEDKPSTEGLPTSWISRASYMFLYRFYELLEDFSVTSDDVVQEKEQSLAVKALKNNISRFGNGVKPIFETLDGLDLLFNWHTPLLTSTVFFMWMYVTWKGMLVPTVLFILVLRLLLNLLEEWRVISPVRLLPGGQRADEEIDKETSVSDKFNIVLQVATKVQNKFGQMADGLEKIKNLLTWKRTDDTKQVFVPLCAAFLLTAVASLDTVMFLFGTFLGIKFFITDPIYQRFPRIKEKYDSTAKLWANLVNDSELKRQQSLSANDSLRLSKSSTRTRLVSRNDSKPLALTEDEASEGDRAFCGRFNLPEGEHPLKASAFKNGRNCILLDKESSMSITAAISHHTKLYLTPSFLCYEMRNDKREAIPLANITRLEKRKPISFLPGSGMSLEVTVIGFDKPKLFGGLLHRDDCYEELMALGKSNDLLYAQDHGQITSDSLRLSDLKDQDELPQNLDHLHT